MEKTNSQDLMSAEIKSFNFPLLNLKTSLCIKEKFLSLFRNKMLTGNLPRRHLFCKFLCFRPMAIDYAAITKWKISWFIIVKKPYSIFISFISKDSTTNYYCYICMQLTYMQFESFSRVIVIRMRKTFFSRESFLKVNGSIA